MVAFCLGLEEGLDAVPFLADVDIKVGRVGYQDDTYLVGAASVFNAGNGDLIKALGDVGHTLRATKCAVWIPSWDAEEVDGELPHEVRGLLARYPRHRGGFKLLGSTAHGDLAVDLRDGGVGLGPARACADRAVWLAARTRDFVVAQLTPQTAHHAWMVLTKCVSHALTYDSRFIPAPALETVERPVIDALDAALETVLAVDLPRKAKDRMRLAGAFGGCGVRREAHGAYSAAGYFVAWVGKADRVCQVAASMGKPVLGCSGAEEATQARGILLDAGLDVGPDGRVVFTAVAKISMSWP